MSDRAQFMRSWSEGCDAQRGTPGGGLARSALHPRLCLRGHCHPSPPPRPSPAARTLRPTPATPCPPRGLTTRSPSSTRCTAASPPATWTATNSSRKPSGPGVQSKEPLGRGCGGNVVSPAPSVPKVTSLPSCNRRNGADIALRSPHSLIRMKSLTCIQILRGGTGAQAACPTMAA